MTMKNLLRFLFISSLLFGCGKSLRLNTDYKVVATASTPNGIQLYTHSQNVKYINATPGVGTITYEWIDVAKAEVSVSLGHQGNETLGKIEIYREGVLIGWASGNQPQLVIKYGKK
jgi:hypothetical protein